MNRRAIFSPASWKQNLLLAASMGAVAALIGCGGGGSGGGNPIGGPGSCGSVAGSGITVVCGFVISNGSTSGVNGVNIVLRTAGGTAIGSATTVHDASSSRDGFYKINVPANAATFGVDFSGVTGYFTSYLRFGGATYDQSRQATVGGPCIPALTAIAGQDNVQGDVSIYSDSSAPPAPVFNCPR